MRGDALVRTNHADAALKDFRSLGKLRPKDAQTQYLIGSTALNLGNLDEGIAAMERVVALAPGDTDKVKILVNALLTKGRRAGNKAQKRAAYGKAAGAARKLTSSKSTYDNLLLQVSAELGAGMYTDAIRTGNAAIAKNGNEWLAYFYVGQAHTSTGQFAQAVNPLQSALTKTQAPGDIKKIWRQLGFAYEKQKDYVKSIDAYQKAGDGAGLARVQENKDTAEFNQKVEGENAKIKEMEAEAARLEEELKALEAGGGR
jgi:tetratricopeptide (TPR) repeat protein